MFNHNVLKDAMAHLQPDIPIKADITKTGHSG